MYGCARGRGANCKMLEGIHQILVFPYCRRQGGRTLLKVQTNKPSSCVISKGQGAEHPQSLFIASIVKVESLDQDFCEAGIPEPDALGLVLGLELQL